MKPTKGLYWGKEVWVNGSADDLRRRECLCLNCGRKDQCDTALTLLGLCLKTNPALMVTRCPLWEAKPHA